MFYSIKFSRGDDFLKKEYEAPVITIEEYELDSSLGNLCSGVDPIPWVGGFDFE